MSVLDRFSTTVFCDPESSGYIAVCEEIPGVSAFGVTRADVHALLARRAEAEGVSQNTLVVALLAQGLAADAPLGDHDATRSGRGARAIASETLRSEAVASYRERYGH